MTVHITAEVSANVSTNALHEVGPDTLIVDPDGYLISSAQSGAILETGPWTVLVNGQIAGFGLYGLFMNLATNDVSTVTIGKTGDIFGASIGLLVNGPINLINLGAISGPSLALEVNARANITNAGTIRGAVLLDNGHDVLTNFKKIGDTVKHGFISGEIDLWGGDDIFNGGAHREVVRDSGGTDTYRLGAGDDLYIPTSAGGASADGTDNVDGGAGVDTYWAQDGGSINSINLRTGVALLNGIQDNITGFENAIGTGGVDSIYGTNVSNVLDGYYGADFLYGSGGRDFLSGGPGADHFSLDKLSDSGTTSSTRDVIDDFEVGIDEIGLGGLDANTKLTGNQAFHLTARGGFGPFTKTPGELKFRFTDGGNTVVSGDVNGDGVADFSIALATHRLLHETDFFL